MNENGFTIHFTKRVNGSAQRLGALFFRTPIIPDAAARTMRRNFGHSMWLGAVQAAACRRLPASAGCAGDPIPWFFVRVPPAHDSPFPHGSRIAH